MLVILLIAFLWQANAGTHWHRHQDYGIYASCHVLQQAKRVWAGTAMVEVGKAPDDAELLKFDSNVPLWNETIHQAHTDASRHSDVLAALQYDRVKFEATLVVWKGLDKTPKYRTLVKGVRYLAEAPAVAVSDDGNRIAVLGHNGMEVFLVVYSPDSATPVHMWSSKKDQTAGARHLWMSRNGDVVAFHRDLIDMKTHKKTLGIVVYDVKDGRVRFDLPLTYSDSALSLSPDAEYLLVGFIDYMVLKWNKEEKAYKQLIHQMCTRRFYVYQAVMLSTGHYVLGLSALRADNPRLEGYSPDHKLAWHFDYGLSGQLQDVPYMMSVTDNEKYLLVASWGNDTEANPTGRVWDLNNAVEKPEPFWTLSTPGSSFCGDITAGNEHLNVVVGGKSVHANIMGRGGELFFEEVPYPH